MLKGQCQKFLINHKCQKRLMFLQGVYRPMLTWLIFTLLEMNAKCVWAIVEWALLFQTLIGFL